MANTTGRSRSSRASTPAAPIVLRELNAAPIVLFRGPERALADRAVAYLRSQAEKAHPDLEVIQVEASTCSPGQLTQWTSPSLFGEQRLIILGGVEESSAVLSDEILELIANPADDAQVILYHRGGVQQRRVVDAVKKAGFPVWATDPIKYAEARLALLRDEIAYRGGKSTLEVAQLLVNSAGEDLHELLGVARQLLDDGGGQITEEAVRGHFSGKLDTDGFQVADAMVAGDGPRAVVLARRAFASGVSPVLIVAAMAYKLRAIAKVSVPGLPTRDLGMKPGMVNRARQEGHQWDEASLGAAICAVARADADVKGASRDPEGAVERCLIEISRRRTATR